MLNFEDSCTTDTGLCLGSVSLDKPHHHENHLQSHRRPQQNYKKKQLTLKSDHSFPSLTLGLSSPSSEEEENYVKFDVSAGEVGRESTVLYLLQSSSLVSAVTSYSGVKKRERDLCGEEDVEMEKVSPKVSDDRDEAGTSTARKKLRLTREQSMVLEYSFKEHTTLNPKRKQDLANQLNLQTRQVEVWFQNRRARTKLKKTEMEYELLKKCYQTLTDENQKLEKELQELKELFKESAPLLRMQTPPATTLTLCPSCCEGAGGDGGRVGGGENSSTSPFSNIGLKPQFYNRYPFTYPSAAC